MNGVQLLVSVRHATEAGAALQGGADIIDAKEPDNGALGACDAKTISSIADTVRSSRPLSVACGELLAANSQTSNHLSPADFKGPGCRAIQYRKYGLAGAAEIDWHAAAATLSNEQYAGELVIVTYADFARVAAPDPREVMAWASQQPNVNLLIDTAVKDGTGLFDWLEESVIVELIATAKLHDLMIGLAGSLNGEAFRRAVMMGPHIVGVRGAACESGQRSSTVSASLVRELAEEVAVINATHSTHPATQSAHVES